VPIRAVRIAVIDSGVDLGHPGVRGRGQVTAVARIDSAGLVHAEDAARDDVGHGTAVAATLLAHVPQAELCIVRVFGNRAECSPEQLAAALRFAATCQADFVNASLGITDLAAQDCLAEPVADLVATGCRLIAPATSLGLPCFPGSLPSVDRVIADPNLDRQQPELRQHAGRSYWFANPLPPAGILGLPIERIRGDSLAVANVTGVLAARLAATLTR
jgi:subtilisin family serine protease